MSDLRSASSEESLKDWTFIAGDGKDEEGAPKRSGPGDFDDISSTDESDSLRDHIVPRSPQLEPRVLERAKEAGGDSDADFAQIDEDPDDHVDEWGNSLRGEESLENSFVRTRVVDDGDLISEECLEGESDCDDVFSVLDSGTEDEDESVLTEHDVDGDELPADYPRGYCPLPSSYNHARNNQVNDWLTTVMFIVLAVVTGVAVGHFFGSDNHVEVVNQETLGKPADFPRAIERPSTVILTDLQKSQMEILKQLLEMTHVQGDMKQRISTLEDENRDLRLRLWENRKRCTRIIHKAPSVLSASSIPLHSNVSADSGESHSGDLILGHVQPSRNLDIEVQPVPLHRSSLPLTISAVVVPPKRAFEAAFPVTARARPSVWTASAPEDRLEFEPFYYPHVDLEELSRNSFSLMAGRERKENKKQQRPLPLRELVVKRKTHREASAAPKSSTAASSVNSSSDVSMKDTGSASHVQKKITHADKKKLTTQLNKIKKNRRKFEEEYAEFKLRWKNTSRDDRKEERLKEAKKSCSKAKMSEECEEGYCYPKAKQHAKYEKKRGGSGGSRFWDALPPFVRKHLSQNSKLKKILRNLGKDFVTARLLTQVVEEVPKRFKMSTDWWDCQWSWWQNYVRNRRASAYAGCSGYLSSWQNRFRQNGAPEYFEEPTVPGRERNKSGKTEEVSRPVRSRLRDDWTWRRAALREQSRVPRDWTYLRAVMREKYRAAGMVSQKGRPANSSLWFFDRAKARNAKRQGQETMNGPSRDPMHSFLKHRVVSDGSVYG